MSMAPVAAATSGNSSGAMKSKTQSIASPGPAIKPSSDIDLFTTAAHLMTAQPSNSIATAASPSSVAGLSPQSAVLTLRAPGTHRPGRDRQGAAGTVAHAAAKPPAND